jgi:hypothetical protein
MQARQAKGLVISLATALAIVVTVYLFREVEEQPTGTHETLPEPGAAAAGDGGTTSLRDQLLHASPQQIGVTPVRGVLGVLMERGYAKGVATVVALTDGTASMYISSGGAVTGGRAYAPARAASQRLCEQAADSLAATKPTTEFPSPAMGRVRFYVLTESGVRTAERDILPLAADAGADPLAPLIAAGDALLAALKEATSKGFIR